MDGRSMSDPPSAAGRGQGYIGGVAGVVAAVLFRPVDVIVIVAVIVIGAVITGGFHVPVHAHQHGSDHEHGSDHDHDHGQKEPELRCRDVIDAYLFDLDGTLIDSERETGEALARVLLRGQGIAIDQADRDFVIGRSWVAIYDNLRGRYPQLAWSREEMVERTAHLRHEVFEERGLAVLPGARAVLARTESSPRALVTGSSRVEVAQVLASPAAQRGARGRAAAARVRRDHRRRGRRAQQAGAGRLPRRGGRCSASPPERCLVIEDSRAGIAAGRAAGCVVVAVRAGNFGGWDQSHAHRVIATLDELTPALVAELEASCDGKVCGGIRSSVSVSVRSRSRSRCSVTRLRPRLGLRLGHPSPTPSMSSTGPITSTVSFPFTCTATITGPITSTSTPTSTMVGSVQALTRASRSRRRSRRGRVTP